MKTLINILIYLILVILSLLTAKAQTTTTTSSSSVTVTITDDDEDKSYSRSFVVIDTEGSYRVKVRFMESMKEKVKSYLTNQFGKENRIISNDTYSWQQEIDDNQVYTVQLKENRLRINVDKELASHKLIKKIKQVGEELKTITSK